MGAGGRWQEAGGRERFHCEKPNNNDAVFSLRALHRCGRCEKPYAAGNRWEQQRATIFEFLLLN